MLKLRRKLIRVGSSEGITLPPSLDKGPECTLAGNRLLLLDPRGEVSEDDLLAFMEEFVEPHLWSWLQGVQDRATEGGP